MKNLKLIILSSIGGYLAYKLIEKEVKENKIKIALIKSKNELYQAYIKFKEDIKKSLNKNES